MIKKFPLLLFLLFLSGMSAARAAVPLDRILVVVNNDVITEYDLQQKLDTVKAGLRGKNPQEIAAIRKQVLDQLVLEKLQLQYADHLGIKVTEKQIDAAVKRIADQNKLSVRQLRQALERDGMHYRDFRQNIRKEIVIKLLLDREINNAITVSDSEVDNMLAQQRAAENVNEEYDVDHILLPFGPYNQETAKQMAEKIRSRIATGESFASLAAQYSKGPNAQDGGKLGWRKPAQLPGVFVEALSKMQPGEVEVVESPNGFHVLKLNQRRGEARQTVTQYHVRHILLQPNEVLSLDEAKNKLEALKTRIQNGEDFAALARAHSEDKASAVKGGDIGWIGPGATVKPFEDAVESLPIGAISDPVQTAFGVHIIQVLGKREQDISQSRDRGLMRQKLMQMKSQEQYDQWLRQLKDEAYVEYKPGS